MTVLTRKHIRYDENNKDVCVFFFAVSSSSELPRVDAIDGAIINEGSGTWDISTGESYGMLANGTWAKQPNGIPFSYFEEVWT